MGKIMHGGIEYGGGIGAISEASDVDLTSPADGQFLKYDAQEEKWVNAQIAAVYHAAGSKTVAQLVSALLVANNEGCVYNMSDSGETTTDFVEGEGYPIREGDNVGIVNVGTVSNPVYKFDLLSGFVDLSDYYDADTVDELLDEKADVADLGDLASVDIDGAGSTKFLKGDGTWANVPSQAQADWSQSDNTAVDYIKNKPTLATVATTGAYSDLSGKPTLGTAAAKDVAATGNASASQVVMGNDTRLTDSRNAADVYPWAKESTKPSYTASEVGLGNVPNVATNDQTPTFSQASSRANIASGEKLSVIFGKIMKWFADLGTAAFKNVPSSGNAATTEVVMGNDTRLSDARNAADVYSWAKASSKPTYTASEVGLGNVPNVATNDQTPTYTQASSRANLTSGEKLSVSIGKIMKWFADLKDLAFIAKDGTSSTKYLRGDGTWQAFPTIPAAANNGTLTIQKNGTNVQTFTANQSSNATANITVPTTAADVGALPIAGGSMTGQITLAKTGYRTNSGNGYSTDQYGNFKHLGSSITDCFNIMKNDGTIGLWYYWETGELKTTKFIGNLQGNADSATNASTVNGKTVEANVPSNAVFTDNNTTYTLSVSGNSIVLTPSSGSANTITVPYATTAGSATDSTKIPLAGTTALSGSIIPQIGEQVELGSETSAYFNIYGMTYNVGKPNISMGRLFFWSGNTKKRVAMYLNSEPTSDTTILLPPEGGYLATRAFVNSNWHTGTPTTLATSTTHGWVSCTIQSLANFNFIALLVINNDNACVNSSVIDINTFKTYNTAAAPFCSCGGETFAKWALSYYVSNTQVYLYIGTGMKQVKMIGY